MGASEFIEKARDAVSARRVYGDPVERDGVTVIPAADVLGGGGGGAGEPSPDGTKQAGEGFGFGIWARPVGAIEITERGVEWKRAPLDLTGILIVALMFALPPAVKAWASWRRGR